MSVGIIPAQRLDQLHAEIQRFYAEQMQALDDGAAERWAATFTEDGRFAANALPEPVRGRADLAAAVRRAVAELAEQGVVHRHWLHMLTVRPQPDGAVHSRCYALVIATPRGGRPALHRSTLCEDVLVRDGEGWLVDSRRVTRDDLPLP